MCALRGGEEEQTPGASVSGLRPWRRGLAALTEVATDAGVQTPLARARTLQQGGGRKKEREVGGSLGNR